jgi:hypothetical protein
MGKRSYLIIAAGFALLFAVCAHAGSAEDFLKSTLARVKASQSWVPVLESVDWEAAYGRYAPLNSHFKSPIAMRDWYIKKEERDFAVKTLDAIVSKMAAEERNRRKEELEQRKDSAQQAEAWYRSVLGNLDYKIEKVTSDDEAAFVTVTFNNLPSADKTSTSTIELLEKEAGWKFANPNAMQILGLSGNV